MPGVIFTTPLFLTSIAPANRSCSICLEPFIEPPSPGSTREDQEGEWAVRVDLVAEVSALKKCCGHILGKRCLEAHLRSPGPWRKQCPLCRDVWFRPSSRAKPATRASHRLQTAPSNGRATRFTAPAADRASRGRSGSPPRERGEQQLSSAHSLDDYTDFAQQVRAKLQIKDGSEEVTRTLEEVEQTLREFYS